MPGRVTMDRPDPGRVAALAGAGARRSSVGSRTRSPGTPPEGIETRAQLDMLREIGCDFGQGFYFSAPMDVDADWLAPRVDRALA